MANVFGLSGRGKPLFFFYDCEATGLRIGYDRIIEVAAVLYTKGLQHRPREFSSLCKSGIDLSPEAEKLTGLTKYALRNEPPVHEVLEEFFDWIRETVRSVSRKEGRGYIPVLVAHGGHLLDFPMLETAVKKLGARNERLKRKFHDLNLHYADTLRVLKDPDLAEKHKLESFRLKDVYKAFFGRPIEGHRALEDAKALLKIFSEAALADEFMATLQRHIQSQEGAEIARQQIRQFKDAKIKVPKAVELLQKNITFEDVLRESQKSEESFARFLRAKCGITDPDRELLEHFEELNIY